MSGQDEVSKVETAWASLALRPEAEAAKLYLWRVLMRIGLPGADSSALQRDEGARSLARDLLTMMGTDINDPGPDAIAERTGDLGRARSAQRRNAAIDAAVGAPRRGRR